MHSLRVALAFFLMFSATRTFTTSRRMMIPTRRNSEGKDIKATG